MLRFVPLQAVRVSLDALNEGLQAYVAAGGFPLPEDSNLLEYLTSAARFGQLQAEVAVMRDGTPAGRAVGIAAWRANGSAGLLHVLYALPDAPPESASLLLERVLAALRTYALSDGILVELPILQPGVREALQAAGFVGVERLVMALELTGQDWTPSLPAGYAIRAWRDDDLLAAARVIHAANVGTLDAMIIPELRALPATQRIVRQTLQGRYGAFDRLASAVAIYEGQIIGVTLVTRRRPQEGFTAEICVLPAYQRRGVGRALLYHTHAALLAARLPTATLGVTAGNPARRLYEQLGYRLVGSVWTFVWPKPTGWPGST